MGIEGLAVLCRLPNGRTQWELAQQLDTSGFGVTISALPGRALASSRRVLSSEESGWPSEAACHLGELQMRTAPTTLRS